MTDLDIHTADLARRQHGLFTATQVRQLGMTPTMIRTRVTRGRWQRLAPGVLMLNGVPVTWHTKVLATCLSTGGVASHQTAAVLHGVRGFRPGHVEVSVARPHRLRPREATVHRSMDLALCTPVSIERIPTTPAARLVVDLGAVVGRLRLESALDDLIGRGLLTWEDTLLSLAAHSRQGRSGCGPLRAVLLERYGEHLPESVLERVFLRLLRERGIDEPVPQHEIHDRFGFVARVDFAYPDRMVAIELDSVRWHLDRPAFEGDHEKRTRLVAAGWVVLAFTWRKVSEEPGDVVAAVRQVLAASRSRARSA